MLVVYVVFEAIGVLLQKGPIQRANLALVLNIIIYLFVVVSYFGECVDCNTENNIQQNKVNYCPNGKVENPSNKVVLFVRERNSEYQVSYRARRSWTQRQYVDKAVKNVNTNALSFL